MSCPHPAELKVRTIETNTELCELCEARDERRDALEMEAHYKAISRAQAAEITRLREAQFSAEDLEGLKFWLEVVDEAEADRRATRDEDLQAGYFPPAMSAESDARFKEVHDNLPYYIRKIAALAGGIAPPSAWISVSERLPELWSTVLIADTDADVNVAQFCDDDGRRYYRLERTSPQNDAIDVDAEQVTHWQPLPAPPSPPPTEPGS